MTNEEIARIAHGVCFTYYDSVGVDWNPAWDEATAWQRNSAIGDVVFHGENPNATQESVHENWMKHMVADGWKYGRFEDGEKKEHPCLVPFPLVPFDQRVRRVLFKAVFDCILAVSAMSHAG